MPGPKALAIQLSEEAVTGLTKLIKAHQTGQQIVLRAQIILAAGQDTVMLRLPGRWTSTWIRCGYGVSAGRRWNRSR